MNLILVLAFLFFIGSVIGWCIELLFRHFTNPEKKWINPGFCVGPYLPIYGFGLCVLFLLAFLEKYQWFDNWVLNKIVLFAMMAAAMTVIEYIAGIFCLKVFKVRLWDYSDMWGNLQGIICPLFSFFWAVLGAIYYFLIHPYILDALAWLSKNLAFSFFIGLFFGVFLIDVAYSGQLVARMKRFAEENEVVVKYEQLKSYIHSFHKKNHEKTHFFLSFRSSHSLNEIMAEMRESLEERRKGRK